MGNAVSEVTYGKIEGHLQPLRICVGKETCFLIGGELEGQSCGGNEGSKASTDACEKKKESHLNAATGKSRRRNERSGVKQMSYGLRVVNSNFVACSPEVSPSSLQSLAWAPSRMLV
jgi:hypothetical protein